MKNSIFGCLVLMHLFSCTINKNVMECKFEEKEETGFYLNDVERGIYDGTNCIDFNNYINCYSDNFENGNFTGFDVINNGGWSEIGPLKQPIDVITQKAGVGIVNFIEIDEQNPERLFTGSPDGGLYYSENGGVTWHNGGTDRLGPFIGVADCIFDKVNPDTWFMATGDGEGDPTYYLNAGNPSNGVFRTTNKGQSWEKIGDFHDQAVAYPSGCVYLIKKLLMHPNNNNIIYAVGTHGLYKTINAQASSPVWTQIITGNSFEPLYDIEFLLDNSGLPDPNKIIVTGNKALLSLDEGLTWTDLNLTSATPIRRIAVELTKANPDFIYASVSDNADSRLWVYHISNSTWQLITILPYTIDISRQQSIAVSPIDANIVYFGDVDGYYTINAFSPSINWFNFTTEVHADVHMNKFTPDGHFIYNAGDGGIFKKDLTIPNSNWIAINNGLGIANITSVSISQTSKNVMSTGVWHCGGNIFFDNEWRHVSDGDGFKTIINPTNDQIIYTSSQNGTIYRNNSLGLTQSSNLYVGSSNGFNTDFELDPSNFSNLLFKKINFGYEDLFRKTNNGSSTAENLTNFQANLSQIGVSAGNQIMTFAISPSNSNIIWLAISDLNRPSPGSKDRLIYSVNAQNTDAGMVNTGWYEVQNLPVNTARIKLICVSPFDENQIFIVFDNIVLPYYEVNTQIYSYNLTTNTWINLKKNFLPCVIPTSIAIDEGDKSILYVGTDHGGVWTLNDPNNTSSFWKVFNNNIPLCPISQLVIDKCNNKIFAGTYGRGIWNADLVKLNDKVINADVQINAPTIISNQNIIIEAGKTLTVQSQLSMSSTNKIIVKRGARLIIDGANAVITNNCGYRWPGIEVWGNSSLPQSSANESEFGKVILRNGGTIENAEVAIRTIKTDAQGNWDWNYTGGIVQCNNANFINCGKAVEFLGYINHNPYGMEMSTRSLFVNTQFITNQNYDYNEFNAPDAFITIDNCSGISFKGCSFKNTSTQPSNFGIYDFTWKGGGILAYNSRLYVDEICLSPNIPCTNFQATTFNDLLYGIKLLAGPDNRNSNIMNSAFTNCNMGIDNEGVNYVQIKRNNFSFTPNMIYNVNMAWPDNRSLVHCYINGATGYKIEENTFTGYDDSYKRQAGIVIANSGGAPNELYKNSFTDLKYDITAVGINRSTKPAANGQGLQVLCNTHEHTSSSGYLAYDNAVTGDFGEPGIALYQGEFNAPVFKSAENLFTPASASCTHHVQYYNELNPFVYVTTSDPNYLPVAFNCNTINIYNSVASNSGCPSKISTGPYLDVTQRLNAGISYRALSVQHANVKATYNLIKDGGNTNAVIQQISQTQPSQIQQLIQDLLAVTPNLSIPVLLEVGSQDDKFDPITQMLLIAANPQGGKNQSVIDTLKNKPNPMPQYMIEYILDNANNFSLLERLESEITTIANEKKVLQNEIIASFLLDTLGINNDSIRYYLTQELNFEDLMNLALSESYQGNIIFKDSILNLVANNCALDELQQNCLNNMAVIFDISSEISTLNNGIYGLTPIQKIQLNLLAEKYPDRSTILARNILEALEDTIYSRYIKFPTEEPNEERRAEPKHEPSNENLEFFSLNPNPANESVLVKYKLPDFQKGILKVIDNTGKSIYEIPLDVNINSVKINCDLWSKGIYQVQIISNGKLLKSKSLVVSK